MAKSVTDALRVSFGPLPEQTPERPKDAAELKRDLLRRQNALEKDIRRDYGKTLAGLEKEIGSTEARIGKKGVFRAVVRKLTGAERRDQVSLTSLKLSLDGIEARIEERRGALKAAYARDWEKLERRHAAERMRDERMIERRRSEGSRGRAGEIARKKFRVRADSGAAGHSPTPSDRSRAAKALDKARRKPEGGDSGPKREVSEERLERARKHAEGAKRTRNRPRNKDRDKGLERE